MSRAKKDVGPDLFSVPSMAPKAIDLPPMSEREQSIDSIFASTIADSLAKSATYLRDAQRCAVRMAVESDTPPRESEQLRDIAEECEKLLPGMDALRREVGSMTPWRQVKQNEEVEL